MSGDSIHVRHNPGMARYSDETEPKSSQEASAAGQGQCADQ